MPEDASSRLAFGPLSGFTLQSDDAAALSWLLEVFGPSLTPARDAPDRSLRMTSAPAAHAELAGRTHRGAVTRPCFVFDRRLLELPARPEGGGVVVRDAERACFLRLTPGRAEVIGEPGGRRWRFTALLAAQELLAAPLRWAWLELHAAAVEAAGRGIVIAGPKRAGKTTLLLELLRSGLARPVANDRCFAGLRDGEARVRGMPTAVKMRPEALAAFPEVALPDLERPYLHSVEEFERARRAVPVPRERRSVTPAQLAARLGGAPVAAAPLGAIVLPRIDRRADGWALTGLTSAQTERGLWDNLFGRAARARPATAFEDLDGGVPAPSREVAAVLARSVPGFRLVLGRGAYDDPGFAGALLDRLGVR